MNFMWGACVARMLRKAQQKGATMQHQFKAGDTGMTRDGVSQYRVILDDLPTDYGPQLLAVWSRPGSGHWSPTVRHRDGRFLNDMQSGLDLMPPTQQEPHQFKAGDTGKTRKGRNFLVLAECHDPHYPLVVEFELDNGEFGVVTFSRLGEFCRGQRKPCDLIPPSKTLTLPAVWVLYYADGSVASMARSREDAEAFKPRGGFIRKLGAKEIEAPETGA